MTSWSDTLTSDKQGVPRCPDQAVPRAWLNAYDYMVARDDGRVRPATADEGRAIHERIVQAWMRA